MGQEPTLPARRTPATVAVAAIVALRPKQWIKNLLVFAALVFSLGFLEPHRVLLATLAFASFCLVSSTGYLFNDARDVEADRAHPKKRFRPIASGALPLRAAYVEMVLVLAAGIALAWLISPLFLLVALAYFVTTLSYTFYFKHHVILDVMFISAGFLWRAVAGAVAIDVHISPWLMTCTLFLTLFLGFNKRRGELALLEEKAKDHRKNLREYSRELLLEFQSITSAGTLISYAIYCVLGSPTPWLLLTLPIAAYTVFRYMYLVSDRGEGGEPAETLFRDLPLLLGVAIYGLAAPAILLLARLMDDTLT